MTDFVDFGAQYILHKVGDYMLQTSWMALNKYERWTPAIIHGIVYTVPFLLITQSWQRLSIIGIIHILIDHYRVASLWARLINNEWKKPQPVIPAVCITEIDQVMHLIINYLVLRSSW